MKLPVDTSAIAFLCALAPEPVIDFQTKQHRADENGEPLYVIQLLAMGDGRLDPSGPERDPGAVVHGPGLGDQTGDLDRDALADGR